MKKIRQRRERATRSVYVFVVAISNQMFRDIDRA